MRSRCEYHVLVAINCVFSCSCISFLTFVTDVFCRFKDAYWHFQNYCTNENKLELSKILSSSNSSSQPRMFTSSSSQLRLFRVRVRVRKKDQVLSGSSSSSSSQPCPSQSTMKNEGAFARRLSWNQNVLKKATDYTTSKKIRVLSTIVKNLINEKLCCAICSKR